MFFFFFLFDGQDDVIHKADFGNTVIANIEQIQSIKTINFYNIIAAICSVACVYL